MKCVEVDIPTEVQSVPISDRYFHPVLHKYYLLGMYNLNELGQSTPQNLR